jgi:hypothetical protein
MRQEQYCTLVAITFIRTAFMFYALTMLVRVMVMLNCALALRPQRPQAQQVRHYRLPQQQPVRQAQQQAQAQQRLRLRNII